MIQKKINFVDVINEVTNAGAALVAIHPRTTKEMYGGLPHWDLVKGLRNKMSIPLLVSGNINTVDDAIKAIKITGADGVMVARGGVGNPLLIKNINNYFSGQNIEEPTRNQQIELCYELAKNMIEEKGEEKAMRVCRGIVTKFFDGFPNSKQLKNRLSLELNTLNDLVNIVNDYKETNLI